jgi:S1-C subfamily serine protease
MLPCGLATLLLGAAVGHACAAGISVPANAGIGQVLDAVRPAIARLFGSALDAGPITQFFLSNGGGVPGNVDIATAFVISDDGYAVTTADAPFDRYKVLSLRVGDGKFHTAKLIAADSTTHLALLKIDDVKDLPYLSFSLEWPAVGDSDVAFADPDGDGTAVVPAFFARQEQIAGANAVPEVYALAMPAGDWSGAPVLSAEGAVVAIIAGKPSGDALPFAVPGVLARPFLAQLATHGAIRRGRLGLSIQDITADEAESLGLSNTDGALVAGTMPDSAAAKVGLDAGDVVLSVTGTPVHDADELSRLVAAWGPGSDVDLGVFRGHKTVHVKATLDALPAAQSATGTGAAQAQPAAPAPAEAAPAPAAPALPDATPAPPAAPARVPPAPAPAPTEPAPTGPAPAAPAPAQPDTSAPPAASPGSMK